MQSGEAWLFAYCIVASAALLFLSVFFVIMFSDLESDYVNPIDMCNRLNQWVIPEMAIHASVAVLCLLSIQITAFVINLPLLVWNVRRIAEDSHMYDATEIFRTLGQHKKAAFIRLGFYLFLLFYTLYRLVMALIALDSAH